MQGTLYTGGTIYVPWEPGVRGGSGTGGKWTNSGSRQKSGAGKRRGESQNIEAENHTLAFIDSHSHLMGVANGMPQVDLSKKPSPFAEVKERIEHFIRGKSGAQRKMGCWAKGINHGNLERKISAGKAFLDGITRNIPCSFSIPLPSHSGVLNSWAGRIGYYRNNHWSGRRTYWLWDRFAEEMPPHSWTSFLCRQSELVSAFEKHSTYMLPKALPLGSGR